MHLTYELDSELHTQMHLTKFHLRRTYTGMNAEYDTVCDRNCTFTNMEKKSILGKQN